MHQLPTVSPPYSFSTEYETQSSQDTIQVMFNSLAWNISSFVLLYLYYFITFWLCITLLQNLNSLQCPLDLSSAYFFSFFLSHFPLTFLYCVLRSSGSILHAVPRAITTFPFLHPSSNQAVLPHLFSLPWPPE